MTEFGISAPDAHPFQQKLLAALPTSWQFLLEQGVKVVVSLEGWKFDFSEVGDELCCPITWAERCADRDFISSKGLRTRITS
jgi:hypothetical protein